MTTPVSETQFRLLGFDISPELWRFIKYALIGIWNGVVDFSILIILVAFLEPERDWAVASVNTMAFMAASLNSFVLHSRLTFQRPVPILSRWFALFLLVNTGNLILSNVSLLLFRSLLESFSVADGQLAILLAKPLTALVLVGYGWVAFRRLFSSPAITSPAEVVVDDAIRRARPA